MTKVIFGPIDSSKAAQSYQFADPVKVLSTNNPSEVLPQLRIAESAANAGSWVAVVLSYEAAPVFDNSLRTNAPSEFPLLWSAVFEEPSAIKVQRTNGEFDLSSWQPSVTPDDYSAAVSRIRALIAAGDTYQVNYTFPLQSDFQGDAFAWYRQLCQAQTANYCAYLELGRYTVLSLSPELFFEKTGATVMTRPMKGTINRGRWLEEDQKMADALLTSTKDRAENVMIVDLLRNDLGRVSIPGSVHVTDLFKLERYETLWQMTSTVTSQLRAGVGVTELMAALFPCGSITGAPKIRTMEVIKELEPQPRGVYCGTIGLIKPGGDCVFNVAIRTALIDNQTGEVIYGVGGGITYDSTADREYNECLLKSSFLERRIPDFQLLETMLFENGEVFLLERHLSRIHSSADYFGFTIDLKRVRETIAELEKDCPAADCKIRLLVDRNGSTNGEVIPLENLRSPMKVALAEKSVRSSDVFLFHKTTNRQVYEDAVSGWNDLDDVILWNERGEITESTIANVVVMIGGEWFTPPRECGLLAGTFRNELVDQKTIKERRISIAELKQADKICLINSVRKWMPVELVEQTPISVHGS